jgi:signal transduction histidine kinase/CheY-like chemotaxis protein
MAADLVIPVASLAAAAAAVIGVLSLWWLRERRMAAQRRATRSLLALAEEIIAASSAGQIVERLTAALPGILRVTGVRVYFADRAAGVLRLVGGTPGEPNASVPLDSAPDSGVALCFRNRTLLAIPDLRRSPLGPAAGGGGAARAMMLIPMLRQGEAAGVIEVTHAWRPRPFSRDERAVAQHLANQVAAALGLLEQQSLRERMLRSERLAASGQLISGVARELRAPLEAVADLAARLLARPAGDEREAEIGMIAREARRAGDLVDRLLSFSRTGGGAPRPLDVVELLRNLIEFREREWAARGIVLRDQLPDTPAHVLGVDGQLEQVFLSLLVHAEQSVSGQVDRTVSVGATAAAGKVLIEIAYPLPPAGAAAPDEEGLEFGEGTFGLAVCRGVLRNADGDIRFTKAPPLARFEVTLPLSGPAGEEAAAGFPARPLTLLIVEPDGAAGRRLLALAGGWGHRGVLAQSGEEAVRMIEGFSFDVLLCDARLPGLGWPELFGRARGRVAARVLLTAGYDADLVQRVAAKDGFVLAKPVAAAELARVLRQVAGRADVE